MTTDNSTTFEVWRRSPEGENLVLSDPSEAQIKDWHKALVTAEQEARDAASLRNQPRPLIRYDVYQVTVTRRKVSP
jgi:hypothetical protein